MKMNATLTAAPLPSKELAPRRRKGAFAGVAEQLARLLPAGARVKVEWQHAVLEGYECHPVIKGEVAV